MASMFDLLTGESDLGGLVSSPLPDLGISNCSLPMSPECLCSQTALGMQCLSPPPSPGPFLCSLHMLSLGLELPVRHIYQTATSPSALCVLLSAGDLDPDAPQTAQTQRVQN